MKSKAKTRFRAARTFAPRYEDEVVGLPSAAMTITNSERRDAYCARRWHYRYAHGLTSGGSPAMYRGRWIHDALEVMYKFFSITDAALPDGWEEQCPLCTTRGHVDDDCELCGGSNLGVIAGLLQNVLLDLQDQPSSFSDVDFESEAQRLERALVGYVAKWGRYPLNDWKVVAVERAFAAPIVGPNTSEVYRARVPVVPIDGGWRAWRKGDPDPTFVMLPWYQLGRLDAVLQHRETGDLCVHEFKTSANPSTYARDLHLDTQIPGYIRLLQHAASTGMFGEGARVIGYQYDVMTSKGWSTPKVLKSGKVSASERTQASVPSWAWEQALNDDALRMKHTDTEWDALSELARSARSMVDDKLYCREFGVFDQASLDQFSLELFAEACRFSSFRRSATIDDSDERLWIEFPRTPVCRIAGHSCSYKGMCLGGGGGDFETADTIRWLKIETLRKQNAEASKSSEEVQCPF